MEHAFDTAYDSAADDRELLALIRRGSETAFATLVRKHTSRFYRLSYRFVANTQEAEDIVQDAFLKIWERPTLWNPNANSAFTTWFYRVVVNMSLDRAKKKRPLPLIDESMVVDERESQERTLIRAEQEQRLEAAIARLPKRQRVALNLCFYEGLSNQEAADVMELKLKALQSLIMRAKTTLKDELMDMR